MAAAVVAPGDRAFRQDRQAVDDDAVLDRRVAGQFDVTAGIVFAVAGNVDHLACGVEAVGGEQARAMVDGGAD
jgi:hypothetical protein